MAACAVQAQQPAPANGAPGPVVHMRQWLAARISEPARRMLDFHMDTYAMVNRQTPLLAPSSRVFQGAAIYVERKPTATRCDGSKVFQLCISSQMVS